MSAVFNNGKLSMRSADDIFFTGNKPERSENEIKRVSVSELHPFKDHPFQVKDDAAMDELVDSVRKNGVYTPIKVRPDPDGDGYEIISGHRRVHACHKADIDDVPVIVVNMSDDEAIIAMVDSNLQREQILPSEKAKAYKMRYDAEKRIAGRKTKNPDIGEDGEGEKRGKSSEIVAEAVGESDRQFKRYLRIANLTEDMLNLVDENQLPLSAAVELSYLEPEQQDVVYQAMQSQKEPVKPSITQAQRLKEIAIEGNLSPTVVDGILSIGKPESNNIGVKRSDIKDYVQGLTNAQIREQTIELWKNREKIMNQAKDAEKQTESVQSEKPPKEDRGEFRIY